MNIKKWINRLRQPDKTAPCYRIQIEQGGVTLSSTEQHREAIVRGRADRRSISQYIALRALVEQGQASQTAAGFHLPEEVVAGLESATRDLLQLPGQWSGQIRAAVHGSSRESGFAVQLSVETNQGAMTRSFSVSGPFLRIGQQQQYTLNPPQYRIFKAVDRHQHSRRSEYDNLKLLSSLRNEQKRGITLDLGHFNQLDVKEPDRITVEIESNRQGDLTLTPFMGQKASHQKVNRVLGQLAVQQATALRVENEIILFDEKKLSAVQEVLKNRRVPHSQANAFLNNPTAFMDGSLVDLEAGFCARVKGATTFTHAYFGETDTSLSLAQRPQEEHRALTPFAAIEQRVEDAATLQQLVKRVEDARKTGATTLPFFNRAYDISEPQQVQQTLARLQSAVSESAFAVPPATAVDDVSTTRKRAAPALVVDIDLNDDSVHSSPLPHLLHTDEQARPSCPLHWQHYRRPPFSHQREGVQWVVDLCQHSPGGLLADDMGLGKTYIALAAIEQLYRIERSKKSSCKPVLVVVPLVVLHSWRDEVDKTFSTSPFHSVVLLQADADLPRFRTGGVETGRETAVEHNDNTADARIRYTLKTGQHCGQMRLDLPERLVITTYQTLRDYQFSLCKVDWSVVVFDEAQQIKNPNTLQTRAAKGLKADFKLLMSGTPVENSLADFWCLMDTACPGHLGSYQSFRTRYMTPIARSQGEAREQLQARMGHAICQRVGRLMLRRLKEDILDGLPSKKLYVGSRAPEGQFLDILSSTMTGHQLKNYDAAAQRLGSCDERRHASLTRLSRLRDITLHPRLADRGRLDTPADPGALTELLAESAKIQALLAVVERVRQCDEKCIVFCINRRLQLFLAHALAELFQTGPVTVINGCSPSGQRSTEKGSQKTAATRTEMIKEFEMQPGFGLLIMSPLAAGVGLTITEANHVVHFERAWNPATEAQATDRVYRIGQKREVSVYIPILHHPAMDSFDNNLHRLLNQKRAIHDAVMASGQHSPVPSAPVQHTPQRITPDDLSKISWEQFEALTTLLLARQVGAQQKWLTQPGADYGADAVVITTDRGYLVQCKHTRTAGRYEGYKAIMEVQAARLKYENSLKRSFDTLVVATNARQISARTERIAKEYRVDIIDYSTFEKLLHTHQVSFEQMMAMLESQRLAVE